MQNVRHVEERGKLKVLIGLALVYKKWLSTCTQKKKERRFSTILHQNEAFTILPLANSLHLNRSISTKWKRNRHKIMVHSGILYQ